MSEFKEILRQELETQGFAPSEGELELCGIYRDFLLQKNAVMNLTAVTEDRAIAVKHFADSLFLLRYGNPAKGSSLLDIGSGAGFPGMVCKIFRPDLKITLMDSLAKRCSFLQELCAKLGFKDVTVLTGRAEEYGHNALYRGSFDYVTARAVASSAVLTEYGIPFLKQGGKLLLMKGKEEDAVPLKALQELGAEETANIPYELQGDSRHLLTVVKICETADKYPRRPGIPTKRPLL